MSIKIPTFNEMLMLYGHQFTELEIGEAHKNGDYDMLIIRLEKEKNCDHSWVNTGMKVQGKILKKCLKCNLTST